jgi:hypothetical protein
MVIDTSPGSTMLVTGACTWSDGSGELQPSVCVTAELFGTVKAGELRLSVPCSCELRESISFFVELIPGAVFDELKHVSVEVELACGIDILFLLVLALGLFD